MHMENDRPSEWLLVKQEQGPDLPLFDVEFRHMKNPRNHFIIKALVLKCADTINVVAITPEQSLILVEQFRFGGDACMTELPAGLIDAGEAPLEAAKRELLEETGYEAKEWIYTGATFLNPAYVNNRCHHFIALDARKVAQLNMDASEDISVKIIREFDIDNFISSNILQDAIGLAALAKARSYLLDTSLAKSR